MKKSVQGFTLVELIIVIVLIGILAAIAIPRFINQTTNARISALNGLVGALGSAVALTQAEYQAENGTSSTTTVTMSGQSVTITPATNGVPAAVSAGIGNALQSFSGYTSSYAATNGGTAYFTLSSLPSAQASSTGTCTVSYNGTTGVATILSSSGC